MTTPPERNYTYTSPFLKELEGDFSKCPHAVDLAYGLTAEETGRYLRRPGLYRSKYALPIIAP
jgi:hypothetical protein